MQTRSTVHRFETLAAHAGAGLLSCEYNFVNLFCWAEIYQYSWFTHGDCLVNYDGRDRVMFMPLGPALDPESLRALSVRALDAGLSPDICLVPENYLDRFPGIVRYYKVEEDRDAAEYIYRTENLAELKGTKLHKKRNLISQFKRNHPDYNLHQLTPEKLPWARKFAGDLLNTMDPVPATLAEELIAMENAFAHWEALGLEGIMITADGRVAAFSVFSPMGQNTYNVHFEKANIALKGAAQLINRETAIHLKGRAEFINREQDLGIEGLRRAKLSYEPHRVWIPYMLKYKTPDL
ncbi:MAG: DUF2156 domain-containing protein [Desulfobacter sp.]|nr:MAG: DUF2156 domain-containing protein [Desulfobacter sp.]